MAHGILAADQASRIYWMLPSLYSALRFITAGHTSLPLQKRTGSTRLVGSSALWWDTDVSEDLAVFIFRVKPGRLPVVGFPTAVLLDHESKLVENS